LKTLCNTSVSAINRQTAGEQMNDTVISNMRGRIQHLRRLAESTADVRTKKSLQGMAREIEADVERLKGDLSA
jgi:hypothetical protein